MKDLDPSLERKYNKFYIGLCNDGQPYTFVQIRPKNNQVNLEVKQPQSDEMDTKIDPAELVTPDSRNQVPTASAIQSGTGTVLM